MKGLVVQRARQLVLNAAPDRRVSRHVRLFHSAHLVFFLFVVARPFTLVAQLSKLLQRWYVDEYPFGQLGTLLIVKRPDLLATLHSSRGTRRSQSFHRHQMRQLDLIEGEHHVSEHLRSELQVFLHVIALVIHVVVDLLKYLIICELVGARRLL